MRTCPACRKRIDVKATKCPYCQTVFTGMQIEEGRRENSRYRWGTAVLLVAALIIILLLFDPNVPR